MTTIFDPQGRRHLRDRIQDRQLPHGVAYMPKPWQFRSGGTATTATIGIVGAMTPPSALAQASSQRSRSFIGSLALYSNFVSSGLKKLLTGPEC
jgi:hypothetical protein